MLHWIAEYNEKALGILIVMGIIELIVTFIVDNERDELRLMIPEWLKVCWNLLILLTVLAFSVTFVTLLVEYWYISVPAVLLIVVLFFIMERHGARHSRSNTLERDA
jgi:cell division protein FtsW (lipid II flippase)